MVPMYRLARLRQEYQRIQCHRQVSEPLLTKTIRKKYPIHLSSEYGIKRFGEIYEQKCCREYFCPYIFNVSTNSQKLRSCGSLSPKTVPIFLKNFINFRLDTNEKQGILKLCSYSNKSYTVMFLKSPFFRKGRMQPLVYFSNLFWFYTILHNRRIMSSIFLVSHTSKSISSSPTDFFPVGCFPNCVQLILCEVSKSKI